MAVQFPANTSVADVRFHLQQQGFTAGQITQTLQSAEIKDGFLVESLSLDLQPQASGAPAGINVPTTTPQQQAAVTERAAKRNFIQKFVDEQVEKGLASELEQKLGLIDGVEIEVRNAVLDKSTDRTQQAFFGDHPDGRILTSSIVVRGDSGSQLNFGDSIQGNVNGNYEVTIELPFDEFAGGTWKEQLKHAKKRLTPLYELARLDSNHFWEQVEQLELPAGTRISRTFNVGGGVELGDDDASVNASRTTRVIFQTTWTADNRVDVTFDTLRTDAQGLNLKLGDVGAGHTVNGSNHQVHSFRGIETGGDNGQRNIRALGEAISWTNGLLPTHIDTEKLDTLGKGHHTLDVRVAQRDGVNAYVPVGASLGVSGGIGGGSSLSENTRYLVTVPDHKPDGTVVYQEEAREWIAALEANDTARMTRNTIPGLVAQRVGTGQVASNMSARLTEGVELIPGWVGVGAVLSFARNTSDTDVVGTKIAYDRKNPNLASVTLWKIDTDQLTRQFGFEVGLQLDPAVEKTIADALGEHLLEGTGLEKYAGDLAEPIYEALEEYTEKVKLQMSYSSASKEYGFESLLFTGMNLTRPTDRAAFEALVGTQQGPADAQALSLAIRNGHLQEVIQRQRDENSGSFDSKIVGYTLLASKDQDWKAGEVQQIKLSDEMVDGKHVQEWLHVQLTEAGVSRQSEFITEKYTFDASAFVVTKVVVTDGEAAEPVPVDAMIKLSHVAEDDNLRDNEVERLEGAVRAGQMKLLQHDVGDGKWMLSWLFGEHYGDATLNLQAVVTHEGNRNLLAAGPDAAYDAAVLTASRVKGTALPPSESAMAGIDWPLGIGAARTRDQQAILQAAGSIWSANVKPGKMGDERRDVRRQVADLVDKGTVSRGAAQGFNALSDAQLDELIYRAVAGNLLAEYRSKADGPPSDNDARRELQQLRTSYSFLTERWEGDSRNIAEDAWILEQGVAMRTLFNTSEMVGARARVGAGAGLTQAQVQEMVGVVFKNLAEEFKPARTFLAPSRDEEALAFWVTILNLAGRDEAGAPQGMALFQVHADDYDMVAATEGVEPKVLDQLMKRSGKGALDATRLQSGGPARVHAP